MTSPTYAVLARYSSVTAQRTVATSLRRFLRILRQVPEIHAFPWADLNRAEVLMGLAALSRAAPSVQRLTRVALKHVLKECWRQSRLTDHQLAQLLDDWPRVKGRREPVGRALSQMELFDLLDVATMQPPVRAARDAALVSVLAGTGCRRHEAIGLTLRDVDASRPAIRIHGKGNVIRTVPLFVPSLWHHLARWLEVRGGRAGPVFLRLTRWDVPAGPLAVASVNNILKQLARAADIHCAPHDLRRTGITWLLDAGVPIDAVQRWAGHAHVQTTLAYRRPAIDPIVTAAEALAAVLTTDPSR